MVAPNDAEAGDGFRHAQAAGLRFHVQWNAGGARAAGEGESDHRPHLAEELHRVNAGEGQQHSVHHEHDGQADVRGHHKAAELDDVVNVGTGDHFGHQRQHAVRRQLHDQTHQLHHPGLQGVDSHQYALAFRLVVFQQLQRCHAEEGGENHHANDRRRAGPGQIGERVFGMNDSTICGTVRSASLPT